MSPRDKRPLTYAEAGVDLAAAREATQRIARLAAKARTPQVLAGVGAFGGVYRLTSGDCVVASADGVGTKVRVASVAGRHETVGKDIVNHCVNDILCQGAKPAFFMDYIACGTLEPGVVEAIVSGVVEACHDTGCALLGGETAEMPGFYSPGEYDLVGFIVGEVAPDELLDASRVKPGDAVIGLASSGLHTNGYSLARVALLERGRLRLNDFVPPLSRSLVDELLEPHRCYLKPLEALRAATRLHALAHVTGGGIAGNLERVMPDGCRAQLVRGSWAAPPIFQLIQEVGGVASEEMYRTFNMGLGMLVVLDADDVPSALGVLPDFDLPAYEVGTVVAGPSGVEWVEK